MKMRVVWVGLFQALAVVGQQAYEDTYSPSPNVPYPFHYKGCAEVDLTGLGDPVTFDDGSLTHAACQAACQGHSIAALFPDSCRCGDDSNAFSPLDSSVCDYPCMGDPAYGMCGSQCPTKGPGISTIYITSDVLSREFEHDEPDPEGSSVVVVLTTATTSSADPTVIPQTVSAPPEDPTGPPADPSTALSESTDPPDTTTRSTSRSTSTSTETEITLFPTVNTTVTSTSSSTSFSTSSDPEESTPNVERDGGDPPTPSQVLQSDVYFFHSLSLCSLTALVLLVVVAA